MQFDEKVLTALEVLTDAAENDFELFRICTLVRDLIAPPQVEQIDEKHQRFNGVIYSENNGHHYISHDGIHRAVWQYYNGEAPAGYEVHHDNDNPADNDIANLNLLTKPEHMRLHARNGIGEKKQLRCDFCGEIFNGVDNGQTRHYCLKCREGMVKTCKFCGQEFATKYKGTKFCSISCAKKFSYAQKLNGADSLEIRTCPTCGKTFSVSKRSTKKFCSVSCAAKSSNRKGGVHLKTIHNKICPICHKEFVTIWIKKIYCSDECCRIARNQAQKKRSHRTRAAAKVAAAESPEKGTEGVHVVAEHERD